MNSVRFPLQLLLPCALLLAAGAGAGAAEADAPTRPEEAPGSRTMLADGAYPIEVSISFSAALFHWLDSLTGLEDAGMSAGKTVQAHRAEYDRRFGRPRGTEAALLRRFGEIRRGFVRRHLGGATLAGDPEAGPNSLLVAFLEEPDLKRALRRAAKLLGPDEHAELRAILEHFAPRYERIWNDGRIPRRFLERIKQDGQLDRLVELLVRIAEFFGVDPQAGPVPHVVLTPVQSGYGTHAQANGRHLLIELRWLDDLSTTASVIVHENVHLLMHRIEDERMQQLERRIRELDAMEAGGLLREALPTALGQGIADRRFRGSGDADRPWYHIRAVDRYAKQIFPLIDRAIAGDGTFDQRLLEQLLALHRP